MTPQPEALRLADELEEAAGDYWRFQKSTGYGAAAELRRLARVEAQRDALLEALKKADQFITNGIELGFIRMPDAETPDSAHETPGIVRAALAQQAEPVEPVAYIHRQGNYWDTSERHLTDDEKARGWTEEPLYTAPPPQRKPLTDEEIEAIWKAHVLPGFGDRQKFYSPIICARAVERAHGIKE